MNNFCDGDSLIKRIKDNENKVRFHTPSHAGKLLKTDITELSYSDNLISPTDVIKNLEEKIASIYKVDASFISTQGATFSNFQAIYAVKDEGAILVYGKSHVSILNAIRVMNAKAYKLDTLDENIIPEDVKSIVVTSPDYEGHDLDLKSISALCKRKGYNLIIDSAHGSHYIFASLDYQTQYGDLVIHSLHKTLPVLTGGSVLLCSNKFRDKAMVARKLYHSTSPSYATMCSIEAAFDELTNGENKYKLIKFEIEKFKDIFNKVTNGLYVEGTDDYTRLVIRGPYLGSKIRDYLFDNGIVVESTISDGVVLIVNPYNYDSLLKVINVLDQFNQEKDKIEVLPQMYREIDKPLLIESPKNFEKVSLIDAVNRRTFFDIGFYPPGVPILYAGEIITKDFIDLLIRFKETYDVFGLDKESIFVIK